MSSGMTTSQEQRVYKGQNFIKIKQKKRRKEKKGNPITSRIQRNYKHRKQFHPLPDLTSCSRDLSCESLSLGCLAFSFSPSLLSGLSLVFLLVIRLEMRLPKPAKRVRRLPLVPWMSLLASFSDAVRAGVRAVDEPIGTESGFCRW
jgi:hypothetical protein